MVVHSLERGEFAFKRKAMEYAQLQQRLLLATYHGLRSKWCNWELGIADSIKKSSNLAILPIESKSGNWKGNEYLQLYPEMKFGVSDLELLTVDEINIHELDGKVIPASYF